MQRLTASLRRRQVDRMMSNVQWLEGLAVPQGGWIAEARGLLGVRFAQIAARLGVYPSTIKQLEQSEVDRSITLNSLEKVAGALGCQLVYAFIPKAASFEDMVQQRAQLVARKAIAGVSHSMALEDQLPASEQQQEMVDELAQELVRKLPRRLWDESE